MSESLEVAEYWELIAGRALSAAIRYMDEHPESKIARQGVKELNGKMRKWTEKAKKLSGEE